MSKRYPGGIIRKTPQTPSQTSAQGVWDMASVTQAVKENTWPIAGVPDPISKSLRFRSSASAYLNRTPASAGNRKTWTFSAWIKRGTLGSASTILHCYDGSSSRRSAIQFNSDNTIGWDQGGGATSGLIDTVAVYRDPSAWYHLVCVADYSNGTAANRALIYINGVLQTVTTADDFDNADGLINSTNSHQIGSQGGSGNFFDGYMTEVYLIDGQALTPSSFGNTNDQTGVWQPIAYTGTYGTNGFYLPFSNTASTTTLGYDFSGNSNNWTTNNISLTSGSTYDSMVDVPTQWIPYNTAGDTGGLFRGNYCVMNPLESIANPFSGTSSNGNLTVSIPAPTNSNGIASTIRVISAAQPKFYIETTVTSLCTFCSLGMVTGANVNYRIRHPNDITINANDVIMTAFDPATGNVWYGRNGTWLSSGNPSAGTNPYYTLTATETIGAGFTVVATNGSSGTFTTENNFGQRPFSYTPPAGFKTLCTTNLPTPTIGATASTQANRYMDVLTWTGDGASSRAITGLNFQPDWVWDKMRSGAYQHAIVDSVRGGNQVLHSNSTSAEDTNWQYGYVSSFNSNGFTIQAGATSSENWNLNGSTFVAWNWNAGGSTVTNTSGSITSQVRANTTAGFSIVTYTGVGGSGTTTVGHGLGVSPSMVIIKRRNSTADWATYHTGLTSTSYYLFLNSTAGQANYGSTFISPSSSTLTIDAGSSLLNTSTGTYVAYCFAPVAGYSAFGSYTGNGSTDGPFLYLGFRPRYILIKRTNDVSDWWIWDTARNTINVMDSILYPNDSAAEYTSSSIFGVDALSNGFKMRTSNSVVNGSSQSYIYAAFAESPFKFSLAR